MSTLKEGYIVEAGVDAPNGWRTHVIDAGLFSSALVAEAWCRMNMGVVARELIDMAPGFVTDESDDPSHLDLPLAGWTISYYDGDSTGEPIKEG